MKNRKHFNFMAIVAIVAIVFVFTTCDDKQPDLNLYETGGNINNAKIILIGESHGIEWILEKEFIKWNYYYSNENLRDIFIEFPYYTAQFLNLWMKSTDNEILNQLFSDFKGTAGGTQYNKNFYIRIKQECPETIFHGIDVGHQYRTTGERFVSYLRENNLLNTDTYYLTLESIEQGKRYYGNGKDYEYRENMMAQNFIREFDSIGNRKIIGIFGSAHTNFYKHGYNGNFPSMAKQLREYYGDIIYFENYPSIQSPPPPEGGGFL